MPAPLPHHKRHDHRNFRCEDELWDAFAAAAGHRATSDTLRDLMRWYLGWTTHTPTPHTAPVPRPRMDGRCPHNKDPLHCLICNTNHHPET